MDQNELEFVNLPQRDNPTLSTVSISTVPGVQVEQVADNAESFTGSNEPVHQHYPEHEEFDELSAMADESDPLWTQGHADEQARITLEVDAVNNASAKAFRMPLTSLKRRKSPQEGKRMSCYFLRIKEPLGASNGPLKYNYSMLAFPASL